MLKSTLTSLVTLLAGITTATAAVLDRGGDGAYHAPEARQEAWPNAPFTTSGRWIIDASGNTVNFAGVNWPGHGEVMIPEGLQYQSISTIISKVKSLGMNVFRLTYAIELVDQIYDNGGEDVSIGTAFVNALGQENGTRVLNMVLEANPQFSADTKRLEVYDAVVEEANRQEIYIHLDNHVSKAMWCCSDTDGNGWWGDTYFDTDKWVRGLGYMADHGQNWPNLVSMSLRNELRTPASTPAAVENYNWAYWYEQIQRGTSAIHDANPDVLIYLSGPSYDTYMTPVFRGTALTPSTATFSFDDFPGYADKLVLEIHNYETGATSCSSLRSSLYNNGIQAMHEEDGATVNVFPVLLTEFGFAKDGATYESVYASCIAEYIPEEKMGWMIWVLVGSYYIRSGVQDYDELWGLLNHDWSDWRDEAYIEEQGRPMVEATLS